MATGPKVYSTIMKAWHKPMQVLDNLIVSITQSIQDAKILLGLTSWHLYPDMTVVCDQRKHVSQHDPLVTWGGILTFGLRG